MTRKKKKNTRKDLISMSALKLQPPTITLAPWTHKILTSNLFSFSIGGEKAEPEPKGDPKTVVGLTGYRLYGLDKDLILVGSRGAQQEGRESTQAKHSPEAGDWIMGEDKDHPAPVWDCLCGFAAFFWPTSLGRPEWGGVLAEVQAGGRTIVCETGWRAERIILNKLWVACPIFPDSAIETLEKRYEVPVGVLK